jgi:hydrogenase maturation protease
MPESSKPSVLVLGIGNTLRNDDGIGVRVVEEFHRTAAGNVECRCVHQLTVEIAETISRIDRVIFVDAALNGNPGEILEHEVLPSENSGEVFSHECSPLLLVSLAHSLYGRAPQATLLTISGSDFGYGETLSDQVRKALPQAVQILSRLAHADI